MGCGESETEGSASRSLRISGAPKPSDKACRLALQKRCRNLQIASLPSRQLPKRNGSALLISFVTVKKLV